MTVNLYALNNAVNQGNALNAEVAANNQQITANNNAIDEKQELIDNNLYQAVADVEQQLTDHRAFNFLGDSLLHEIGNRNEKHEGRHKADTGRH